ARGAFRVATQAGLPAPALQVPAERVEAVVPLLADRRQPVARLAALALRFDEPRVRQRREVLRDGLPRHRQLTGELRRRRRAVLGEVADYVPARLVGERREDLAQLVRHARGTAPGSRAR